MVQDSIGLVPLRVSKSLWWQATPLPSTKCFMGGSLCLQRSVTYLQRGWKWQPDGGAAGSGTSPVSAIRTRFFSSLGSARGTADIKASV